MRDPITELIEENIMYAHTFGLELAHGRQQELRRRAESSRRAALVVPVVRRRHRAAVAARIRPAPRPV